MPRSAETRAPEPLLSLLFSALGRGAESSGSAWSGCTCPRPLLHRHPQPLLGRLARLQLHPALHRKASVPFEGKQDQTHRSSLELVGNQSSMNFCRNAATTQGCTEPWVQCGRIQPKSSASSGAFTVWSIGATGCVSHQPTASDQTSATSNGELLLQT